MVFRAYHIFLSVHSNNVVCVCVVVCGVRACVRACVRVCVCVCERENRGDFP